MKALKFLFIFLATLNLAACAFDKNSNVDDKREAEDTAFLREKFDRISGLYHGAVNSTSGPQEVDLTIYRVDVPNGTNSRGDVVSKPALRARYRRTDTVTTDVILIAKYLDSAVPARLSITNVGESDKDPQSISLDLTVYGETLVGNVVTGAGLLGDVTFKLIDRNAKGPAQDDSVAENKRREAIFRPVLGIYEGDIIPDDHRAGGYNGATVTLQIDKRKDETTGKYFSILRARFHPSYENVSESADLFMDVDYSPANIPPRITLSATSWVQDKTGTVPNYVFDGNIENGVITATFTGNGFNGTAILKRK
jgi:hypothetical protein